MDTIASRLTLLKKSIPFDCTLIAVSKTKPHEAILEGYATGHRHFGENKVQELVQKAQALPKDIHWHMIGHLQRNKVKYIAPFVHLIHGVDSLRLLQEIDKRAMANNRTIHCLFQVHIAEEESKFGFSQQELFELIESEAFKQLKHIQMDGLMGMATNTSNPEQVRKEFHTLNTLFQELMTYNSDQINMSTLSMGMSGDYQLAIDEGSNMVRVGSAIFGARN